MTHDDPLKQLETALRIAPSKEFAARVRVRVKSQSRRRTIAWTTWGSVAAATLVLTAAGAFVWHSRTAPATGARAAAETAHPVELPPMAPAQAASVAASRVRETARLRRPAHATPRRLPAMDVIVPGDQKRALDQLLLDMRNGEVTVPAGHVLKDEDGYLLDPPAIEISLLNIELLPGTPVADSGGTD